MVRTLVASAIAGLTIGQTSFAQGTPPPVGATPAQASIPAKGKFATETDRQVIETLLLSLVDDKEFPAPMVADKTFIALHRRTPKGIKPLIDQAEVSYDTGAKAMPKDAWDDLVRRNVARLDPNAREIHYEGLQFDPRIQVGNAFPGPEPPFLGKTFEDVFPKARAWVEAYVPGYSKDGKTAIVRARFGPAGHLATLTAILNLQGGKWNVVWRRFSVYQ
jgi:hypothetical protein